MVEDAANTISESSEQITLAARNTKGVNSLIGDAGKIVSLEKEKYASIGAARAGSAGAGFAVVANSIRTLASESKESAIKIHELIEVTLKAVENGKDKVKETAETLNTEKITDETRQVKEETQSINESVMSTSAVSEENYASSAKLSNQALLLKELTQRFKLKNA